MKNNVIIYSVIVLSAFVHVAPMVCVAGIAAGDETVRAISTVFLIASCLALGYVHGMNRTIG